MNSISTGSSSKKKKNNGSRKAFFTSLEPYTRIRRSSRKNMRISKREIHTQLKVHSHKNNTTRENSTFHRGKLTLRCNESSSYDSFSQSTFAIVETSMFSFVANNTQQRAPIEGFRFYCRQSHLLRVEIAIFHYALAVTGILTCLCFLSGTITTTRFTPGKVLLDAFVLKMTFVSKVPFLIIRRMKYECSEK